MRIDSRFLDSHFAQPKLEVGNLVRGHGGVRVPRAYGRLDSILSLGTGCMARSENRVEHAFDYRGQRVGGVSGLLNSHRFGTNLINRIRQLEMAPTHPVNKVLHAKLHGGSEENFQRDLVTGRMRAGINKFCELTHTPVQTFLDQTSFSYWEYLPGINATLVADDVFPQRLHVMVSDGGFAGYCLADVAQGKFLHKAQNRPINWNDIFENFDIANFYQTVRTMPFFDPGHCPIIEAQLTQGAAYFLQYHIGRDFVGRTHHLDRAPSGDEREFTVLRGATTAEGSTVLINPLIVDESVHLNANLDTVATGSFGKPENAFHEEIRRRHHIASLIHTSNDNQSFALSLYLCGLATSHGTSSTVFKPQVALLGNFKALIPEADKARAREALRHEGYYPYFRFHVVSDGERAFVRYEGYEEIPWPEDSSTASI